MGEAQIWYPEVAESFSKKLAASELSLEDHIEAAQLIPTMRQLSVWPLLEALSLVERSCKEPISADDKRRVQSLKGVMMDLTRTPLYHQLAHPEHLPLYRIKILGADDAEYLIHSLRSVETCMKGKKLSGRVKRFAQDMGIGGTFMFMTEKFVNGSYVPKVYNKLFVTKNKADEQTCLFFDAIENGNMKTDSIAQWIDDDKLDRLSISLAMALHAAQTLDVSKLLLGDRELEEAGELFGVLRQSVIDKDKPKAGMECNYQNKGPVIYQNRIYGRDHAKHRVLEPSKMRSGPHFIDEFERTYAMLERVKFKPGSKKYAQRAQYVKLLHHAMQDMGVGSPEYRESVAEKIRVLRRAEER